MKNKNIFTVVTVCLMILMLSSCTSKEVKTCPCGCKMDNVCEMVKACPMKDTCPMKDSCQIKKACETNNMELLKSANCPCGKGKCPLMANSCKCEKCALNNKNSCTCNKMVMTMNGNNKTTTKDENIEVTDFESCVKAGGIILKTLPPKCKDPKTGTIYTKKENISK